MTQMHFSGLSGGNNLNLHSHKFLRSSFLIMKSVSVYLAALQEYSLMELYVTLQCNV